MRVADLERIAEDAVEPHLERGDPGTALLFGFDREQGSLCVAAQRPQGIELRVGSFANDPAGPDGKWGFGGCDVLDAEATIDPATVWVEAHHALVTLWGRIFVPADRVVVELQDGSSSTLPVVEGGFLASLDRGARIAHITAYDGGDQVATWDSPSQ